MSSYNIHIFCTNPYGQFCDSKNFRFANQWFSFFIILKQKYFVYYHMPITMHHKYKQIFDLFFSSWWNSCQRKGVIFVMNYHIFVVLWTQISKKYWIKIMIVFRSEYQIPIFLVERKIIVKYWNLLNGGMFEPRFSLTRVKI